MQPKNIENTVVDGANHRKYVVLAPKVLSDGEIYEAIRRGNPQAWRHASAPWQNPHHQPHVQ